MATLQLLLLDPPMVRAPYFTLRRYVVVPLLLLICFGITIKIRLRFDCNSIALRPFYATAYRSWAAALWPGQRDCG